MSVKITDKIDKTEKIQVDKNSVIIFKSFMLFMFGGRYRIRTYGTFYRSML